MPNHDTSNPLSRTEGMRSELEDALRHRVRFEELITALSAHFINLKTHEIDSGINHALKTIGEFVEADRCSLFLMSPDGARASHSHRWCRPEVESHSDPIGSLSVDYFSPWIDRLRRCEAICVPRVDALPSAARAAKALLVSRGIQSVAGVPMISGGSLIGFLSLIAVRTEQHWSPETIALLQVAGEMLVNALERKRTEEELRKVHRALRALSECNQALMRATDESALLEDTCRIIVEVGGYRFAWVGYMRHDDAQTVRPMAHAGHEEGYLSLVDVTWADTEHGRGPAGTAIRTGRPCVIKNTLTDPAFAPWRDEAIRRGYMASAGVPLILDGNLLGALLIYAHGPGAFEAEEMRLLVELADDLAYGIGALRTRAEQKRVQEQRAALLEVAMALSSSYDIGETLRRVQQRAATVLGCDAVATFGLDTSQAGFRMIAHYGVQPQQLPEIEQLAFSPVEPFGGRLAAGETIVINDMSRQQSLSTELCARLRIAALIAAPIRVRDRHFGALVAANSVTDRRFDAAQIELCKGIAHQLAVAIEAADAFRAQQEEAHVSAALARVGQELMASLDVPGFLDQLGRVTAEVLECESSHTLLYRPDEDVYAPVAGFGATPEERQVAQLVKVPRAMMSELLARLEQEDVALGDTIPPALLSMPGRRQLGVMSVLCMALRRGKELIGLQVALPRGRAEPFTPAQRRIAQGIAQVASVALEHARVVKELERANRLRSDFVATMSHELRTPLNIIMGYNDLLRDEVFGSLTHEQIDVLQRIDESAQQLLELITTTLDLSRLETGRLPLELKDCCVPDLISEVDAETRHQQDKPGLSFVWNIAPQLPRLHTDPVKLKVIVKNLISNAVKFTELGSVTVDVDTRDNGVEFAVTDTGIGIATVILPIIFEPFRQGDSSATRHHGGVGLGLYIVRRFLDLLGGTISVESEVGRGSVFRAWLPPTATAPSES
jgi:signal transduction histidine kinase/putative methionine-R-sulfoxide reductase with GAF domain